MNPLLALLAVAVACWSAWRELAARLPEASDAMPLALVVAALAVPCLRGTARLGSASRVPTVPLVVLLCLYTLAVIIAPPLLRIAPAVLAVCYCLHAASQDGAPPASFYGLVLLALPVLPSLEFYTAYPVRLAAIEATAALLRMNGIAVGVDGLALRFGEQLIQFDAPCSGVRMLWAGWFFASALAHLYRLTWWRYVAALAIATGLAIGGNIVRASSLFYLEAKLLPFAEAAWMHEAVGTVAFGMTALLVFLAVRPRRVAQCPA
ncbi:MAG TPA: archaeosortase/exosortase family protein [Steroidobacteraceae bacterium]